MLIPSAPLVRILELTQACNPILLVALLVLIIGMATDRQIWATRRRLAR